MTKERLEPGLFHPESEEELVRLVKRAYHEGRQLRVRGSAHSVSAAIYADSNDPAQNRVGLRMPPPSTHFNVALDRYRGFRVTDSGQRLVEVDAGISMGGDPSDPTEAGERSASLLATLARRGWTLDMTGGITHQTVSGFTATGSSGGSVHHSLNDNLWGFRIIDGRGDVHEITRDDDPDAPFWAMAPNLGLLGVVSAITFKCCAKFDVEGVEAITTPGECAVDLLDAGTGGRSLERFLRETEFARLEWWPQRRAERVVVWTAGPPDPLSEPRPYERLGSELRQYVASLVLTVLGNREHVLGAVRRLGDDQKILKHWLPAHRPCKWFGPAAAPLAWLLAGLARGVSSATVLLISPVGFLIRRHLPWVFRKLLDFFVPLGRPPKEFCGESWLTLPMDNEASDVLLPTGFTELWFPLDRATDAMQRLSGHFSEPSDIHKAYRRTGLYGWELYAAKASSFWLSPSYTSGTDEWRHGAFRIDPWWFAENADDPIGFYTDIWCLFRKSGIPFRLHWGKYQPRGEEGNRRGECVRPWVDFRRESYPRWDDFLRLREQLDPNNIFLTEYWRDLLGLRDAPWPRPRPVIGTWRVSRGG